MATDPPQEAAGRARAVLAGLAGLLPEVDTLYQDLHTHPELSGADVRTAGVVASTTRPPGSR